MISVRNRALKCCDKPLLTVFCWAFNDKPFIDRCIEGILNQVTDFQIEIIIHDDASTDGTIDIINKYSFKYPGLFNNILNIENNWSKGINVAIPLFTNPKGKYVALIHADDYWIDPFKLQKQVFFLEKNNDYSFCFHKVNYVKENNVVGNYYESPPYNTLDTMQIIKKHYVATSSVVFRKSMLSIPRKVYSEMFFNDICLEIFLSNKGPVYYFEEIMSVYRSNDSSISNQYVHVKKGRKNLLLMYSALRKYFGKKYFFIFTFLLLKVRLGYVKDFVLRYYYKKT